VLVNGNGYATGNWWREVLVRSGIGGLIAIIVLFGSYKIVMTIGGEAVSELRLMRGDIRSLNDALVKVNDSSDRLRISNEVHLRALIEENKTGRDAAVRQVVEEVRRINGKKE
jgi:hypothetical protein